VTPDVFLDIVARLGRIEEKLTHRPVVKSVWLTAQEAAAHTGGSVGAFRMWARRHGLKSARNRWSRLDVEAAMRRQQERKA
jgi:hypothetical protein